MGLKGSVVVKSVFSRPFQAWRGQGNHWWGGLSCPCIFWLQWVFYNFVCSDFWAFIWSDFRCHSAENKKTVVYLSNTAIMNYFSQRTPAFENRHLLAACCSLHRYLIPPRDIQSHLSGKFVSDNIIPDTSSYKTFIEEKTQNIKTQSNWIKHVPTEGLAFHASMIVLSSM